MASRRRVAGYIAIGVGIVLLLAVGALLFIAQTDWGRERVRRTVLAQLDDVVQGRLEIGRIEGNLLRRFRLVDVLIEDEQGRPFLRADTLAAHFSLRGLLRQRIELADVRLVRAVVVLDEPPGEEWNYVRIFGIQPDTVAVEPTPPGWGDWVALDDLVLVESDITVRTTWEPPDGLTPAEEARALERALAGETRENVVAVPGGHQNVMEFRSLDALLPRVLVAHPDTAGMPIEVARFSGIVQPFRPPAADVRDLAGSFRLANDTLHFRAVTAELPSSRLAVAGAYALHSGELLLTLDGAPVAFADLRWLYPPLPEEGGGSLTLRVEARPLATHVVAERMDLRIGGGTLEGRADVTTGDTLRLGPTDLRFAGVDTRALAALVPDAGLPRHGLISGRLEATGRLDALRVDGDVTFVDHAGAGTSRVLAAGVVGFGEQTRFQGLRLELRPLQAELVRAFAPDLPLRGTIAGTALLTGRADGGAGATQLDADLTLRDPQTGTSRVLAAGGLEFGDALLMRDLRLRFQPLQAALVREFAPDVPLRGTIAGTALLNGRADGALRVDSDLALNDPATGTSRVLAVGGLDLAGEPRLRGMRLRFDPLRLDLLRPYLPDLPPGATLAGRLTLDGVPTRALVVDGDVTLSDPRSGVSHVAAAGGVRFGDAVGFDDLDVRFDPLRVPLLQAFAPDLPIGGSLTGTARLNGAPATRLGFRADLVHVEAGQRSHVSGTGTVATAGTGWAEVDLALRPLSLVTVGRFAPGAGLRGSVAGDVRAQGTLADLRLTGDLRADDGGLLRVDGTFDLAGEPTGYDVRLAFQQFDLSALSWRAPAATDLTGTLDAAGRGFELATMRATVAADLTGSAVDGVEADLVRLRARVDDGLVTVDSSVVRIGSAEAEVDGSFGLIAARSGTLAYRVAVDSLHALAPWIAGADTAVAARADTVVADAGPVLLGRPIADNDHDASHDTVRVAAADTLAAVPADSLAGSLFAEGTVQGNVTRFDASGRAQVEELFFQGSYVGEGQVEYRLAGVGTEQADVTVEAQARTLHVAGMAFDSVRVDGDYRGDRYGTGQARLAAYQDEATDLVADVEFTLSLDRSELRLADATLRFDTVTWRTVSPGTVSWGGAGVEITTIELVGSDGGRIFADGRLPIEGAADLELQLANVEIGPFAALFQPDSDARGRLDLDADVAGTQASPRITGEASLTAAQLDGRALPDLQATFAYAERALTADAELSRDGMRLAGAQAALPVDLALADVAGPRLLPGEIVVDIVADSLPADALPAFSDQLEDVQGRIRGHVAVRGTFESPRLDGVVDLDLGSLRIVPLGVRFDEIGGTIRLEDRLVRLDSLVAWSDGPVRIEGTVDAAELTAPVFDLEVTAVNSRVIDTGDARLNVDAELAIAGPFDAVLIDGDIRTRSGVIYIPRLEEMGGAALVNLDDPGTLERLDEHLVAERDRLLARSPLLENVRTDINVIIDRDVWLRSTEANVEIYTPPDAGALRIRMNGQESLALEGTIITDRGEYEFMSRRFRLSRGTATFVGGPEMNPLIQIAAEHEVRLPGREAFEIRVLLGGTLRDLTIALESSAQPPISQTDLLSYVAFGRDASSLLSVQGSSLSGQGSGSGALVGNVAGIATQQLAAVALQQVVTEIEAGAMRSLGVDVFRVTPADLPPELFTGRWLDAVRGTEVEAGRYVSPRLFVAGQARLGLARPGVRAEYWTPEGFQWRTSWLPSYRTTEPTLAEPDPRRTSVFGLFLFREWRF